MAEIVEALVVGEQLFWLFALAAFFIGMSKGGLPGIGMLSVPLLALSISPVAAAAILLPIFIFSDVAGVWLYRREFSLRNIAILIPAGVVGVVVGWLTATMVSDRMVSLLVGVLGVAFCLNTWVRDSPVVRLQSAGVVAGLFWGSLSGFTSFVAHAGAPPYQVYVLPQRMSKNVFAGTTTIVFAAINLAKAVPYASLQTYTWSVFELCVMLLPVALIGTVSGKFMIQKMSEKWFFLMVQLALFAISIKLILQFVGN